MVAPLQAPGLLSRPAVTGEPHLDLQTSIDVCRSKMRFAGQAKIGGSARTMIAPQMT